MLALKTQTPPRGGTRHSRDRSPTSTYSRGAKIKTRLSLGTVCVAATLILLLCKNPPPSGIHCSMFNQSLQCVFISPVCSGTPQTRGRRPGLPCEVRRLTCPLHCYLPGHHFQALKHFSLVSLFKVMDCTQSTSVVSTLICLIRVPLCIIIIFF